MRRAEFDHVIRAAADIVDDELVVIGSQAILAEHPDAPEELLRSQEVDLFPRHAPERSIEIDANIGDGSAFHATYGYYAHGVGPETLRYAPAGWQDRLVRLELPGHRGERAIAWCLSTHDLILAKLAAGRPPRDIDFVEAALKAGIVDVDQLRLGVELLPDEVRKTTKDRLEGILTHLARVSELESSEHEL